MNLQTTSCGFYLQVMSDGQVPEIPETPDTIQSFTYYPPSTPSRPLPSSGSTSAGHLQLSPTPTAVIIGDPNGRSLSQESALTSAPSRISPTRYWQQQIGFGSVNPNMALDDDHITEVTREEEEELVELPATAMATGSGKSSRDESLLVDERASSELNIDAIDSSSVRSFSK